MNQVELKNKSLVWLTEKSKTIKTRPHSFTPKEVAQAVGGAYTLLGGRLAIEIVDELRQHGISIRYLQNARPCRFELFIEKA